MLDKSRARYLTISPNGQYIIYGVWRSAQQGPGFLVDRHTFQVGEICSPIATFIDGFWLSDELYVYRMALESGAHTLQILDVPSWTTQIIYESTPGYGINIFGFTPHYFPDS